MNAVAERSEDCHQDRRSTRPHRAEETEQVVGQHVPQRREEQRTLVTILCDCVRLPIFWAAQGVLLCVVLPALTLCRALWRLRVQAHAPWCVVAAPLVALTACVATSATIVVTCGSIPGLGAGLFLAGMAFMIWMGGATTTQRIVAAGF